MEAAGIEPALLLVITVAYSSMLAECCYFSCVGKCIDSFIASVSRENRQKTRGEADCFLGSEHQSIAFQTIFRCHDELNNERVRVRLKSVNLGTAGIRRWHPVHRELIPCRRRRCEYELFSNGKDYAILYYTVKVKELSKCQK